ncbi:hypothetical protein [Natronosalvus amylolyticus]|uniref:hypothetical protein n=1 Tax=Natronosalvus amylolyticus TaxID=2961994 RepID=UPI0020C985DD|nr:hypothetical protein [Natronosalvus amylolyticus]
MHADDPFTHPSRSHTVDVSTLSPAARAVVEEARPTREASLPATLCHTVGAECSSTATGARSLEALVGSLTALEGYVRIRRKSLSASRPGLAEKRTTRLLASDYLFARAHGAVAAAAMGSGPELVCQRRLTSTSSALVASFVSSTHSDGDAPAVGTSEAILAELGCAFGALAADVPERTHDSLESFGRSLGRASNPRVATGTADSVDCALETLRANTSLEDEAVAALESVARAVESGAFETC